MVAINNSLSIRLTLERILVYAENPTDLPLVIRTDSHVTSDILRDACERLIKNSKKVVTLGSNAITDEGLNIVYNYATSMFDESLAQLKGKKYIIIVDWDFEPDEETLARIELINCLNKEALTVSALYSLLKTLPDDLYIFACEDLSKGLLPIKVNQVTPGVVGYAYLPMKLCRVRQMLDELEPISSSDRAAIYPNAFFIGLEDYNPKADYAVIEMVSKDMCVDKLVSFFRQRK